MGHQRKLKKKPSPGELRKYSVSYMGNNAKVNIKENPEPEYEHDDYRANIRIYPDYVVTNKRVKKSCPVLAVYGATTSDIDVFIHSLASAIISLKNAKRKLARKTGEKIEEDDI